jgi:hypothetical protein
VLAVAAVLAACGGGGDRLSRAAYERELASVARPLQATLLRSEAPNASRAALARRVADVQGSLRRAAARLEVVRPPKDAAGANDRLAAGMREFAQSLDAVSAAARSGTAEEVREAKDAAGRSPGATKMNRALGELRDAGYAVR